MASFPPSGPTSLQQVLASYLYVQYNDDPTLQAFVSAYNTMAQAYVDCFNGLNLPVYTSGSISGALLDWVAQGLYGISRPGLPIFAKEAQGAFNTVAFNSLPFNGYVPAQGQAYYATSDDTFKRVITWFFYKGDGKVSNVRWLKRRIERFLNGVNGTDYPIDATYDVSISFPTTAGPGNIPEPSYSGLIRIPISPAAAIFQAAVASGVLELPFQWTWTVETWTPKFGWLQDSHGQLITDSHGYPISSD